MDLNLTDGLFASAIVILIGYAATIYTASRMYVSAVRGTILFVWHTLFAIFYAAFTLTEVADATMYFQEGIYGSRSLTPGTDFVIAFTSFLQEILGQSYLPVALACSMFGAIGLVIFDGCLQAVARNGGRLERLFASAFVFLPSLSFWSAGLGKDAIAFFAAALFSLAMFNIRRRYLVIALSVVIMGLVRPHFAAIMIVAVAGAALIERDIRPTVRITVVLVSLVLGAVAGPFVLNYVGLRGNINAEAIQEYMEERQGYNLEGGSSVDIASMNPILRVPAVMLRPTLLEARSLFLLVTGFENAVLTILFAWSAVLLATRRASIQVRYWRFGLLYSLMGIAVLSQTVANLGIANRQKWMAFLPLLIICMSVVAVQRAYRGAMRRAPNMPLRAREISDRWPI